MQPTLSSLLRGALSTLITARGLVEREIARRENTRGEGGRGFEPNTGCGWGALSSEQQRRTATANLANALTDARDALSRALTAVETLSTLPAAPLPDASSAEAK